MKVIKKEDIITLEAINELLEEGECFYVDFETEVSSNGDDDE